MHRWQGINDVDLAVRVLDTDFFRNELIPVELPVDRIQSLLSIAPHQDDAAIGTGGTMILANEAGADVSVLYVTDGAQHRPDMSVQESVRVRSCESDEACRVVNARKIELGLSNLSMRTTVEDIDRLSAIIQEVKPDVVALPWLLDAPVKHRMTNHLLWLAATRSQLPEFEVWGYQVHNTPYPNGMVDITSVIEQKRQLVRCFRSQNEYFKCYDHQAIGMAAWNSRFYHPTPGRVAPMYFEVFFALPLAEYLDLLRQFYFADMAMTYRGDSTVLRAAVDIHRQVMGFDVVESTRQSA
jgi:LmbE family N-acetylglucosaminyl deacetylase